jgi:hypothetical protein
MGAGDFLDILYFAKTSKQVQFLLKPALKEGTVMTYLPLAGSA